MFTTPALVNLNLPELDFKSKLDLVLQSRPYDDDCIIDVTNDKEAVESWLTQHVKKENTFRMYQRESTRFLLWCIYEAGKSLSELRVEDFNQFFDFLSNPPSDWCRSRKNLRLHREGKGSWRPFVAGLSNSAKITAIRAINSLMNYLVNANYLRVNPIKLIKQYDTYPTDLSGPKYSIMNRMLEEDEWEAIQETINEMPTTTEHEIDKKMRTQFLFSILYLLGLRINEVVTHTWSAFRIKEDKWWFFVKGKGDSLGHIPVNDKLLRCVKSYRLHLGKTPTPLIDDFDPIFLSKHTKAPISVKTLYSLVKNIGIATSKKFSTNLHKQEKLKKLSPHWLRHLSASHQSKAGIPSSIIQENHRHKSKSTTDLYIHSEDDRRFSEMQKIDIDINPTIPKKEIVLKDYRFIISIKGGGIEPEYNFKCFLDNLSEIMSGYDAESEGFTLLEERFRIANKSKQGIKIEYLFFKVKDIKALDNLIVLINKIASIRLFSCKVWYDDVDK